MESLSQELIDAVIEEVYLSSCLDLSVATNLRTTSLVCQSWLPTSQRLLFQSVDLTHPQPRNCPQLYGALLESPHLAGYIKRLWVATSLAVPPSSGITPFLLRLNQLELISITISVSDGPPWDVLDLDFKQAIVRIFQLPSMRDARIFGPFVGLNDLTSLLYHARSLSSISLDCAFLFEEAVAGQQEDEGQLERFDLRKSEHLSELCLEFHPFRFNAPIFIAWLLGQRSHFTVENIHTLSIRSIRHREDGESIQRLLHAIGTPLKTLSFSMYSGKWSFHVESNTLSDFTFRRELPTWPNVYGLRL